MISVAERLAKLKLGLGESPVWDPIRRVVWFIDILAPAVLWFDPKTSKVGTFDMPAPIGCVGLAGGGRLIVGLKTGVHLFDPADQTMSFVAHPEPERTTNRLNDGRVGPDGCFWVGSMHDSVPRKPSAALYRVSPDGRCDRVIDGLCVSNGLAWSPDGRRMYHADTRATDTHGQINFYDFDTRTGAISNGQVFATLDEAEGLPDGAAVDANGCYWSAGVTAGCLNRFSPMGILERKFRLPAAAPTMPCFGGAELRTLYVTTLTRELVSGRDDGAVLCMPAPAMGLAEYVFGA